MIYKLVKIEDHAILISRGKTPKYGNSNEFRTVKSAQVRIDKIDWEGCQTLSQEFGEKCPLKFILKEDDVLLNGTGTGTLGRPGIVRGMPKGNYVPDSHVNLIRTKESLESKYLFYWLISPTGQRIIDKSYTGSTNQIELASSRVGKFRIPLPPLEEQKKIAAILDAADSLRQKDKALIAKYEELTQSLFLDMFGDPVMNSKGWEKSEVIKHCSCIVPGRDKPKSFTGNTPWVTTEDLEHLGYTEKSKKEIGLSLEEIATVKAKVIPAGSVIVTCVGDLGVVSINNCDVVVNQQLHTFQCTGRLNSVFLMYNLSYQKSYMYKMASSTTVPYMNKTVCNNIPTILPPINLQNQFAERVQQIEKQKQLAQQSLQKSEELFNSLLQRAFKGELTKTMEPV